MELKINGLTKEFKDFRAVDHVSCSMERGVYGLLGVNGAGKTTLMRMICTLLRPTEGTITWDGKDIFKMDAAYRKILGYLPQDFGFYPDFTVQDYMMYISSIKGLRPAVAKKRTEVLLDRVGLKRVKKKKMRALSGGMQRRVGVAQAMLNDPKILILDEPTAGLDPNERIRFRNLISELSEDRLVLLSTHIVSDVEFIAGDILLMKDGKFFMNGTADEIISGMDQAVWSCTVPRKEADRYLSRYLVSNVKTVPGGVELRILAERCPVEGAVMEEAALEDAFLLYFGEKAGEHHDGKIWELTGDVIAQIVADRQEIARDYPDEAPDTVYGERIQAYSDITQMVDTILGGDEGYSPGALQGITTDQAKEIYSIREQYIEQLIQKYGDTPEKQEFLRKQYEKTDTPFYYEPADSWDNMRLYATTYGIILVVLIGFLAAGIFSDEFSLGADAVFFSCRYSRTRAVRSKILTGLLMATVIYWAGMALLSGISFAVMGVSGFNTPDQLVNILNCARRTYIYQIGSLVFRQIPFIMLFYALAAAVFLPLIYQCYRRYGLKRR